MVDDIKNLLLVLSLIDLCLLLLVELDLDFHLLSGGWVCFL